MTAPVPELTGDEIEHLRRTLAALRAQPANANSGVIIRSEALRIPLSTLVDVLSVCVRYGYDFGGATSLADWLAARLRGAR